MVEPTELIPNEAAAALLNVKPQTLACWRVDKRGPDFYRIGRAVFYRRSDIMAWIAAQRNARFGKPEAA
jgi:hypothetical protein